MPRFTAQVWVSGDHPYEAEINAANIFQAKRNLARREGVEERHIHRVFPIDENHDKSNSSSGNGIDIGSWGAFAIAALVFWLLLEFTPWILMFGMGATGAWVGQKITGTTIEEYAESDDDEGHVAISIILVLSLLAGGFGFVKGTEIKQSINANDNQIEEVQQ